MARDVVIIKGEGLERVREKVLRWNYQASRMYVKATRYLTRCYLLCTRTILKATALPHRY